MVLDALSVGMSGFFADTQRYQESDDGIVSVPQPPHQLHLGQKNRAPRLVLRYLPAVLDAN